jgi:hypothetical protein
MLRADGFGHPAGGLVKLGSTARITGGAVEEGC